MVPYLEPDPGTPESGCHGHRVGERLARRNVQLLPYTTFRSFRALDDRDPSQPYFREVRGEFDAGLDAKVVLKDQFVVDGTVNPYFSQVESDDPQVTLNQRFEVYFPEKRPFFMENATYFRTPIDLVFTRRIADPQFGAV